jgi:hypothetical protein
MRMMRTMESPMAFGRFGERVAIGRYSIAALFPDDDFGGFDDHRDFVAGL